MFRAILVPLDGSACAETAIPVARAEAVGHVAPLILIYVIPRPELAEPALLHGGPAPATPSWGYPETDEARQEAERYLRRTAQRYRLGPETALVVAVGDPYLRLLREIERQPGTMLVACPCSDEDPSPVALAAQRIMQRGLAPVLSVQIVPTAVEPTSVPLIPPSYGETVGV
jgi:nucleotide-binding universal stress UspA family protein